LLVGGCFSDGLGSHRGEEVTKKLPNGADTTMTVLPSPRSAGQSTAGVMKSRPVTRVCPQIRFNGE
jgi:hypothetical protein